MDTLHEPQLFESLWRDISAFLLRRLKRRVDAEDITQDTMLEVLEHPPGDTSQIRGWVRVVARRRATRVARRERQRRERELRVARPDASSTAVEAPHPAASLVARYLVELREPYRTVVRLRYLEGLEVPEIAGLLERPPTTVRSQLKRGLDQLRVRLAPEEPARRRGLYALFPAWLARLRARPRLASAACALAGIAGVATLLFLRGPRDVGEGVRVASASERPPETSVSRPLSTPSEASRVPVPPAPPPTEAAPARTASTWSLDLVGTISETDGTPVEGAVILVGNEPGTSSRVVARTDAAGHYEADGVGALEWLWVETVNRLPTGRHLIGSTRGGRLDLSLRSERGRLHGRIVAANGSPVAGARVSNRYDRSRLEPHGVSPEDTLVQNPPAQAATTDAEGRFQLLRDPAPGPTASESTGEVSPRFFAESPDANLPGEWGFLWISAPDRPAGFLLVPATSDEREVEFRLPTPCRLVARILDGRGEPVANAPMEVLLPTPFDARTATSDAGGVLVVEALPPGPFALRTLPHPGGPLESCFVTGELDGEDPALEVRLGADTTLRGRATREGRPLAGRRIRLRQTRQYPLAPDDRSTRTDEDGSFAFVGCNPNATSDVQLLDDDTGFVLASAEGLRSAEPVLLEVAGPPHLAVLRGLCEAEDESRPTMVAIHSDSLSEVLVVPIGDEGSFTTPPIPRGPLSLRFWIPGLGTCTRALELADEPVPARFRFPRAGALELHVVGQDGEAPPAHIAMLAVPSFLSDPATRIWRFFDGHPGEGTHAARLPPDAYQFVVRTDGFADELHRALVEEDRVTLAEVRLHESVPMVLEIVGPGDIRGEGFTVVAEEGARRQPMLHAVQTRPGVTDVVDIPVRIPRDAMSVRVATKSGLKGRLEVSATELVPGGVLRIELKAPSR